MAVICSFPAVFGSDFLLQTHLSYRCASLVEDQAAHIVGEVGERDLGLSALDADGAAIGFELCFIALGAVGGVGPDVCGCLARLARVL